MSQASVPLQPIHIQLLHCLYLTPKSTSGLKLFTIPEVAKPQILSAAWLKCFRTAWIAWYKMLMVLKPRVLKHWNQREWSHSYQQWVYVGDFLKTFFFTLVTVVKMLCFVTFIMIIKEMIKTNFYHFFAIWDWKLFGYYFLLIRLGPDFIILI